MNKRWFEELAGQFRHDPHSIGSLDVRRLIEEVKRLRAITDTVSLSRRLQGLRDTIRFHAHLYYNLDQNEISDHQYDQMYKRLQEIEKIHPELVTPDSPTQLIGGTISSPLRDTLRDKETPGRRRK